MQKTEVEGMAKVRRSVSLSEESIAWIQAEIKRKRFKDVSHALDFAVYQLMQTDATEKEK